MAKAKGGTVSLNHESVKKITSQGKSTRTRFKNKNQRKNKKKYKGQGR